MYFVISNADRLMPWIATFLGAAGVAYSMTLLEQRRRARGFYGSLIGGMGLILGAMVWSALT